MVTGIHYPLEDSTKKSLYMNREVTGRESGVKLRERECTFHFDSWLRSACTVCVNYENGDLFCVSILAQKRKKETKK